MTILSRMFRLCKADLHGVMDQIEDKGLLLKQYLREMETSLNEKQTRQSQLIQTSRQIQGDLSLQNQELEKLEKDLELAIRKEKDDIAKVLIRKRRVIQAGCDGLRRQLKLIEEEGAHLAEILNQQMLQYQEMKVKAAEYCRWAEQQPFTEAAEVMTGPGFSSPPTEEEIELELLQRKEALKQGGVA
ncbi:MAG: PspA/IM30 family protein [Deltaproteobacteria bacterium]|nr:PspA/IM30 family protein [Deltaproteobacteria bacterium]